MGVEAFSIRESEVIHEVIKGKGVKEVANDLHISFHTADTHLKNARSKTGARNMAELVFIFLKRNKHLLASLFLALQLLGTFNNCDTERMFRTARKSNRTSRKIKE